MDCKKLIIRVCSILLGFVLAICITACQTQNDAMVETRETTTYAPNEAALVDNIVINGEALYLGLSVYDAISEGVEFDDDFDLKSIAMPEFYKTFECKFNNVPVYIAVANNDSEGIELGEAKIVAITIKTNDVKEDNTAIIGTVPYNANFTDIEEKLGKSSVCLAGDNFMNDDWILPVEGKNMNIIFSYYNSTDNSESDSMSIMFNFNE